MTRTHNRLRAVVLAALMVLSVIAAGTAFVGTAAAAQTLTITDAPNVEYTQDADFNQTFTFEVELDANLAQENYVLVFNDSSDDIIDATDNIADVSATSNNSNFQIGTVATGTTDGNISVTVPIATIAASPGTAAIDVEVQYESDNLAKLDGDKTQDISINDAGDIGEDVTIVSDSFDFVLTDPVVTIDAAEFWSKTGNTAFSVTVSASDVGTGLDVSETNVTITGSSGATASEVLTNFGSISDGDLSVDGKSSTLDISSLSGGLATVTFFAKDLTGNTNVTEQSMYIGRDDGSGGAFDLAAGTYTTVPVVNSAADSAVR